MNFRHQPKSASNDPDTISKVPGAGDHDPIAAKDRSRLGSGQPIQGQVVGERDLLDDAEQFMDAPRALIDPVMGSA